MPRRLKPEHPLAQKIEKLHEFMEDNKLSIEFTGMDVVITDTETNLQVFYKDAERALDTYSGESTFPCPFETKYIIVE